MNLILGDCIGNVNGHKIKFIKSPEAQCIIGNFFGWYQVWEAYLFKDKFLYTKPFTYSRLSDYNKLVKQLENRIYNYKKPLQRADALNSMLS